MKIKKTIVLCRLSVIGIFTGISAIYAQKAPSIIPRPQHIEWQENLFQIQPNTGLVYDDSLQVLADYFNMRIKTISGFDLIHKNHGANKIRLNIDPALSSQKKGYYHLSVNDQGISLSSAQVEGLFYGIQTILQQLPAIRTNEALLLPFQEIQDWPILGWRGLMLDVSRHFYPAETIKSVLDLMAYYKLNVFHWHLVDTEGWRLEIKKYPKLTKVGAWREEIPGSVFYNKDSSLVLDGNPYRYGGYYTQDEVREIVNYAKERQIIVIPEIELPGHSGAALAAYPHLSCNGNEQTTPNSLTHSGVLYSDQWNFNYCAGRDSSFEFLEGVFEEVMDLFPSQYIHIGGDEVDKRYWETCIHCQNRMEQEGLNSEDELQSYFIKRIEAYLNSHGKKMIGWDEILEGGLSPSATVMGWRGEKGGIKAAQMGNDVIMSPSDPLYLNRVQVKSENEPFGPDFSINSLENVYNYHPIPEILDEEESSRIIGTQIAVWTEFISSVEHLEYMLLPRLPAFAELSWSGKERKDFESFVERLNSGHFQKWKQKGIRFHPAHFADNLY